MKTIPIFFTFDKNYVLAAKVAIHSLIVNASKEYNYELYVLHTSLSEGNCNNIKQVVSALNAKIHFINVSDYEKKIEGLKGKSHYSKEIFYKLIAADLFQQYERIICTDVDVVFTGDISEVFFMFPDEDFIYAGVGPIENKGRMQKYDASFNKEEKEILEHEISAGFLLINLKSIRERNKQEEMINYYIKNYERLILPEQDCMILTCWPKVRYIPIRYLICTYLYTEDLSNFNFYKGNPELNCSHNEALICIKKAMENPIQLHYAGPNKPWNSIMVTKQREWFKAMIKTGCLLEYIYSQPMFIVQKIKRYSLRRFIRKHLKI